MNLMRFACFGACLMFSAFAAHAEGPEAPAHGLAEHACFAKNGTFDRSSMACTEPADGSPSGDPIMGPMMRGLDVGAQEAEDSAQ